MARLSTAGMTLQWAVEATANTRPSTGYKVIPEIKTMPSFNPSPETIQSTTLQETEFHTYVEGLKDLGGALEYGANLTEELISEWATIVEAYNTANDEGKSMWFVVVHDSLPESVYFKGKPSSLGMNEASVGSMLETTLYITPQNEPAWYAKPAAE